MLGVTVFVLIYWLNPPGNAWLDNVSLIAIGFLIYGPVMLHQTDNQIILLIQLLCQLLF
jgi:sugar phosphate permease